MLAAYAGHLELTQELLKRGADPNRLNDLGQSTIGSAVFKGYDEVVRALAKNSADPCLGTPNAIQLAHIFGRKDMMEVLGSKEGDMGPEVPAPLNATPTSSV
jgi:ankyrin repeat protein